jgi:hypothetical protein
VDTLTTQGDPAGRWRLIEFRPHQMKGVVASIWHFGGSVPQARERHVADGFVQLVIPLEGGFDLVHRGNRQLPFGRGIT